MVFTFQLVARQREFKNLWPSCLLEQCVLRYQSKHTKKRADCASHLYQL